MQNPSSPHPHPYPHPHPQAYPQPHMPGAGFPPGSAPPSASSPLHSMSTSGAPLPGGGFTAPASAAAAPAQPQQPFQYPPTAGFFSVLASTMANTVSATGKPFAPVAGGLSRGARVVRMTMTPSARRLVAPPTQVAKPGHAHGSGQGSSTSTSMSHPAAAAPMTAGPPQSPAPLYPSSPSASASPSPSTGGGGVLASHLGHGPGTQAGGGIEMQSQMQMQGGAYNPLLAASGGAPASPLASPGYPYAYAAGGHMGSGAPMGNVPMAMAVPAQGYPGSPAAAAAAGPYGVNPYAAAIGASHPYGKAV